ncbi:Uncharacterised protein [Mycobacteroides abscessus subsp. abscessus]|nr:Uncharacterised protein [Mycobacteroides abscessus subsp. abscessus]
MLASVCHFLADEPRDLLLEFGIGDLIGVTPDRADKELFPLREHRRQHRHHVT